MVNPTIVACLPASDPMVDDTHKTKICKECKCDVGVSPVTWNRAKRLKNVDFVCSNCLVITDGDQIARVTKVELELIRKKHPEFDEVHLRELNKFMRTKFKRKEE